MSRQFEEAFRLQRLPYRLKGQQGFYDRAVIRDILAYVRLAVNPRDNIALTRIADTPKRGLSAKPLKVFSVEAARRNLAIADVLSDVMILAQLDEKARTGARALGTLLGRLRSHLKRHSSPRDVIEDILHQINYGEYLAAQYAKDPEKLADAQSYLDELIVLADEHDSIEEFMQYIAIMTNTDNDDPAQYHPRRQRPRMADRVCLWSRRRGVAPRAQHGDTRRDRRRTAFVLCRVDPRGRAVVCVMVSRARSQQHQQAFQRQ
jgi:DNA helicase-2/ATP-dependent DNA helicase PcrA